MQERDNGINKGLVFWGVILGLFTGLIGLAIAIFGEKWKRRDRLIGIGAVWGLSFVLAIIVVAAGSSDDDSTKATVSDATKPGATAKAASTAPAYKFRVSGITCDTDSGNTRTCTGTVTNISDKQITDTRPVMHWTGGTDSDLGSVDINPILPGQSATFTTYTLSANPALTRFTIGFKKIFGKESDFPVEPITE